MGGYLLLIVTCMIWSLAAVGTAFIFASWLMVTNGMGHSFTESRLNDIIMNSCSLKFSHSCKRNGIDYSLSFDRLE